MHKARQWALYRVWFQNICEMYTYQITVFNCSLQRNFLLGTSKQCVNYHPIELIHVRATNHPLCGVAFDRLVVINLKNDLIGRDLSYVTDNTYILFSGPEHKNFFGVLVSLHANIMHQNASIYRKRN